MGPFILCAIVLGMISFLIGFLIIMFVNMYRRHTPRQYGFRDDGEQFAMSFEHEAQRDSSVDHDSAKDHFKT